MIYDNLLNAAKLAMKEIEANAEPDYGKPLSDKENPWHHDYYRLKQAVDELETLEKDYWYVVDGECSDLLTNLDLSEDAEFDLETQMQHSFHEMENEHPWLLDDDKAIVILQYSNHPCQEPSNFGSNGCFKGCNHDDPFPFRSLAAEAFSEDVKDCLRRDYGLETFNNQELRIAAEKEQKFQRGNDEQDCA